MMGLFHDIEYWKVCHRKATDCCKRRYYNATYACKDKIHGLTDSVPDRVRHIQWSLASCSFPFRAIRDDPGPAQDWEKNNRRVIDGTDANSTQCQDDSWNSSNGQSFGNANPDATLSTHILRKPDYDLGKDLDDNLRHMQLNTSITHTLLEKALKAFQLTIWELAREHWPAFFEEEIKDGAFLVLMAGGELKETVKGYLNDEKLRMVCPDNRRRRRLREELLTGRYGIWNARNLWAHPKMRELRDVKPIEQYLRDIQEAVFLLGHVPRSQEIRGLRDELEAAAQKVWDRFLEIDQMIATKSENGEDNLNFLHAYDPKLAEARKADLGPPTEAGKSEYLRRIARYYINQPVVGVHCEGMKGGYEYY